MDVFQVSLVLHHHPWFTYAPTRAGQAIAHESLCENVCVGVFVCVCRMMLQILSQSEFFFGVSRVS